MADQITNYQCPACTGPLHFVGSSGKLECDYCGSVFDVAEIEALYAKKEEDAVKAYQKAEEERAAEDLKTAEKEEQEKQDWKNPDGTWDTSDMNEDWGEEGAGMRAYNCPSCGAELICDETTADRKSVV